jgi:V/A-type H+-transporting ATPase subunit K
MEWLGQMGLALPLGLGAAGSALGIGAAGRAAAGAWAKEARADEPMNFKYIVLLGMPLSQTIYGLLVSLVVIQPVMADSAYVAEHAGTLLSIGLAAGMGEMFSAWMQGMIGAAGVRAMSEAEGKPLANTMIAMGIAETVGIFTFVLMFMLMPAAG